MVRVYKQHYFTIYQDDNNEYIIHNTHKPFDIGHTHLTNFHTAKYLIKLSHSQIVPDHLSIYLIDSLMRITSDEGYINKLKILKQKELKKLKKNKTWY